MTWRTVLVAFSLPVFASAAFASDSVFGTKDKLDAALIGILYDLKKKQNREPTKLNPGDGVKVLDEFFYSGWDEGVLNRFFRATRALYATRVFIPSIEATAAPRAFEVDEIVQPRLWAVHYKGQVAPPEEGRYRFVGYADDIIGVAVNGRTVLLGGHPGSARFPMTNWRAPVKGGARAANGRLITGDWFEAGPEKPVDLDVLISEIPGGSFNAFLLIEKEGGEYEMKDGFPVLPAFRLEAAEVDPTPPANAKHPSPEIATGHPAWRAVP